MGVLLTVGVGHREASLELLETAAAAVADRAQVTAHALALGCAEVLVLSTCSRVELHAVVEPGAQAEAPLDGDAPRRDGTDPEGDGDAACRQVGERLVELLTAGNRAAADAATVLVGDDAVTHLFRVAAGLDSRIVGETEVQAQLRLAARHAGSREGTQPHRLRHAVAAALASAREAARRPPALQRRGMLAERAVARVLAEYGPDVQALVVGAGAMGRQVMEVLRERGGRGTLLSRRTSARSAAGPRVRHLEELPERLATADVVLVATSAGRHLLTADLVARVAASRSGSPLTLVDLSLPRNVDPAVADLPGVCLVDLDGLGDRASGISPDTTALDAADVRARHAAAAYCAGLRSRRAGPVITAMRARVEDVCLEQLRRTARGLDLPDDVLRRMAGAVGGAIAHEPTVLARQAAAEDDAETLALLRSAFRLEPA